MKFKSQSGRSMVEMLGTLAIIGVLSVGSIAGFRIAMDKRKTNDIVSVLNRTTVLTHAQALNGALTVDSLQDTLNQLSSSYLATAVMCSSGYAVKMAGLPKGVCKNLADMADDSYYIDSMKLYIGNDCASGAVACSDEDDNAIAFIFDMTTNTDGTAEDAFYYCESNAIKMKGEKVANCQCSDSDGEIQYNSPQDAINELCQETSYYCSYNGGYIEGNSGVVTNCKCTTEGSFKTDEDAIAAMCKKIEYYCSTNGELYEDGGRTVNRDCGCETNFTAYHHSDEEAIAAMCQNVLKPYACSSGGFIYGLSPNSTFYHSCNCGTNNWDSYYGSDEEAIVAMCTDTKSYYCGGSGVGIDGQGVLYGTCNCKATNGIFDSLEEAVNHLCEDGYYECSSGQLYHRRESYYGLFSVVTECDCKTTNVIFFYSESEAIAAMCGIVTSDPESSISEISDPESSISEISDPENSISEVNEYYCSSGVIYGPNGHLTTCNCTYNGTQYYDSDEEAIADMCQKFYECNGPGTVMQGSRHVTDSCASDCNSAKNGFYGSDEEAIAVMCQDVEPYFCATDMKLYQGNRVVLSGCNCVTYDADSYYSSDEAAIKSMCKYIKYICSSGSLCRNDDGYCFDEYHGCYNCEEGNSAYYYSDDEAIAEICSVATGYECVSGNRIRPINTNTFKDYACRCNSGATGFYNSMNEAIAEMCSVKTTYKCVSGNRIGVMIDLQYHYCTCNDGATGFYDSDEEAIAAMCQSGVNYRCSDDMIIKNNANTLINCGCDNGVSSYYSTDEEAIVAMCQDVESYFCSANRKLYQGNRVVISGCNCVTYNAVSYYSSDEEAIKSMCKYGKYICSGGALYREDGGAYFYTSAGCYNCEKGNAAYYYSDEEAIAKMCSVDTSYYYCNTSELRKALNNGQSAYVIACDCVVGSTTAYYDSDKEAIAAMCQPAEYYCSSDGWLAKRSGDQNSYVMEVECNCTGSRNTYNSDEEAIEAMCRD